MGIGSRALEDLGVVGLEFMTDGLGRAKTPIFINIQVAFGSLLKLDSQFQLALDLTILAEHEYQETRAPVVELVKRLSALRSPQLKPAVQ